MKKLLRSTREWLLRPVTQDIARAAEEARLLAKRQEQLLSDAVIASASTFLDQIEAVLSQKQLGFRETIEAIRDQKLSFARFGDGEFKSMLRSNYNLRFQPSSPALASALKEVFTSSSDETPNLLVGFPTLYRDLHWSRVWIDIWPEVRSLIRPDHVFGNSHVSRPICFQILKKDGVALWRSVWEGREVVIITGKNSRMTLIPELFNNASSIARINSEPVDAFSDLERVFSEARTSLHRDKLFLIALGPAGTVLAHRLALAGEQAIDIGHISDSYETVFSGAAWPELKPITRA